MAEVIRIAGKSPLCIAVGNNRHGMERMGVPTGGCADFVSHALANRLVGNATEQMTLEMTLIVPKITFADDALFALCGGTAELFLMRDGEKMPVEYGKTQLARCGDVICGGAITRGLRAYLAIDGGIVGVGDLSYGREFPPDTKAGFKCVSKGILSYSCEKKELCALEGIHTEQFSESARELFFGSEFTVSAKSDRMGLRLEGAKLVYKDGFDGNIISEAVVPGDIQVTPDGDPILMLCDCQPTGGYAKIAHIASCDIPRAAQLRPGERIHFSRIAADEAIDILRNLRYMIETAVENTERSMVIVVNGQRYEVGIRELI